MVNVIIAGLPKNLNISKFIEYLELNIFQEKITVGVNYFRWYKRDLKKLSLNMRSNDARKAIRYLNGYQYVSRRINYSLVCWKEDAEDGSDNEEVFEPPNKMIKTSNLYDESNELQVIDHKIELIRKQRILLEEESQLLLQKKRLEMIQNLGPNDFRKLSMLEEMSEINQSVTKTRAKNQFKKSSDFHRLWQIIHQKMKGVIKVYVSNQDHPIFIDLLRARIKNRLSEILKDKDYMSTKAILALYRGIYPEKTDVSLIQEILIKITQSIDIITKFNVGEENEQDDTGEVDVKSDSEDVTIVLDDSQNRELAFNENVVTDIDNNTKQNTEKGQGLEGNLSTEEGIKYEPNHIFECENNTTDSEYCEFEVNIPTTKIDKDECKATDSNETSEESHLDIKKEICLNVSEVGSVIANNQIEPSLNEVLDMDNDLDDWLEDEKDDQQEIEAISKDSNMGV